MGENGQRRAVGSRRVQITRHGIVLWFPEALTSATFTDFVLGCGGMVETDWAGMQRQQAPKSFLGLVRN